MFIGAIFKIQHYPGAESLLIAALLEQLIFALCCLYEIKKSKKTSNGEIFLWAIGLIAATTPVGLIYLLSVRKRITQSSEQTN